MSRPKNCTAKIRLSFEKKGAGLKNLSYSSFPKSTSKYFKSGPDISFVDEVKNGSSSYRIARSVNVGIKPPRTLSSSPADQSNLDANIRVSSDDKSNVFIEIGSDDISSLRASINSYLRLADASFKCITEGNAD